MGAHPWAWFLPVIFYFVGSIPTGYLLGRLRGIDVRQHGSGNIGATNVWRVLGRNWGLAAFAVDFLKGFLLLYLVRRLGFRGGKGVATSAGVVGALMPWALLVVFSLWLVLILLTRTVSIGSIAAAAALPPAAAFFYAGDWIYFTFALAAAGLAIGRHRANIRRLVAGTEPKLGQKTP